MKILSMETRYIEIQSYEKSKALEHQTVILTGHY
jgi:hypothetical protein